MIFIKKEYYFNKNRDNSDKWISDINLLPDEKDKIYTNWIKINNEYFYIKECKDYNELIGEIISKEIKLNTASYSLAKLSEKDDKIYYISKNFLKPNVIYFKTNDFFREPHQDKLDELKEHISKDNYLTLNDDISKMFSNDIFMRQLDRCYLNIIFEKNEDKISLGPIFDYSDSLGYNKYADFPYLNSIYDIYFDSEYLNEAYIKYPKLRYYLQQVIEIDILKKLKDKLKINDVILTSTEELTYEQELEKSRKLVKIILNK